MEETFNSIYLSKTTASVQQGRASSIAYSIILTQDKKASRPTPQSHNLNMYIEFFVVGSERIPWGIRHI